MTTSTSYNDINQIMISIQRELSLISGGDTIIEVLYCNGYI